MFSQDRPELGFHEDERDALGKPRTLNHIGEIPVIIRDDDGVIFVFIFQELNHILQPSYRQPTILRQKPQGLLHSSLLMAERKP